MGEGTFGVVLARLDYGTRFEIIPLRADDPAFWVPTLAVVLLATLALVLVRRARRGRVRDAAPVVASPGPSPADDVQPIAAFEQEWAAQLAAGVLRESGIPAVVQGGLTAGFRAEAPGRCSVLVPSDAVERARALLAAQRAAAAELDWDAVDPGEPAAPVRELTCARCGYVLRGLDGSRCPECGHDPDD